MALSAAIVWECRASGASDNSGGGFVAGATGTDFSQQNSAQVVINNSTITTSITANVITFTGYTPTSADVGNIVQMLTGTNVTAGWYQITAQTATTWTVTGAVSLPTSGTTTNATGNMGGALATFGKLSAAMVASNKAYITGTFTTTTTATFTQSTGAQGTGSVPPTRLIGYGSVRGDAGHAQITLNATSINGIAAAGVAFQIEQIDVDCAGLATTTGISLSSNFQVVKNCKVMNFTVSGIAQTASVFTVLDCEATGGTAAATAAISSAQTVVTVCRCFVHDNLCTGISLNAGDATAIDNIIVNNTGGSSDGIRVAGYGNILNNTIHNCGRHGINGISGSAQGQNWRNNILSANGGFGAVGATAPVPAEPEFDGNAYFNNTSGTRSNMDSTTGIFGVSPYVNVRDKILTGSPFSGPTTGTSANFGLNNTAGAGAACRAAGSPGTWPGNTGSTGFLDMGAVQHQDTGGSVLVNPDMCGGMHG